jgi:RHS repeat-associated protein
MEPAAAQTLACNPQTPRLDPGSGFTAFGASEQALARGGNSGPAWEWAVGTATESGQKVQGSLDWVSGRSYTWTLTYSGSGAATLELRDAGAVVLALTYASGMDAGNALELQVATNPSIGPDTTIAAGIASLKGKAVSGALAQTGSNQESAQRIYLYYPPMSQGFAAQGTVALSYASLPTGSRVDFRARAGTLACTNSAPSVSITAPAAGTLLQAGIAVTVSAQAQDADGTIGQVEFFANGVSIGTDSSAPYSVQWTPAGGAVELSARARDNAGDQTASAALAVTVNAQPAISLTSPANGATFSAPAEIAIAAQAADPEGTIASLAIYQGEALITTLTAAPYSFTWSGVPQGSYLLTARATDNHGATVTSAPVAITVRSAVAQLYFIHVDHLNTPRLVANAQGQTVWLWHQAEPFGDNVPDENPSGLGAFDLPLRLPGQYFDKETNLHYNYFRDYDPSLGRYVQSDPMGLLAGLNTYVYVHANPLRFVDPTGLVESCSPESCTDRCVRMAKLQCSYSSLSPAVDVHYGTNSTCLAVLQNVCYYSCNPSEALKDSLRATTGVINQLNPPTPVAPTGPPSSPRG